MKLSNNFSWNVEKSLTGAATSLFILSVISILAIIMLTSAIFSINNEAVIAAKDLGKMKAAMGTIQNTVSQARILSLENKIAVLSSVSKVKKVSLGWALSILETKLPGQVVINKITFDGPQGVITLQLESANLEEISSFIKSLDNKQYFDNVEILQQLRTNGNTPTYKYDIKLTE